jgi:F-type H+-transporting ATPase subunit delta
VAKLVIKRYATALFDIATEENKMQQYELEVQTIVKALGDEPDFTGILQNQKITLDEKLKVIEKVFASQVSASIVGLMALVVKKGRQQFLIQILQTFLELVKKQKGILKASVTSAVELKAEQIEKIKSQLENGTKSQVEMETVVDPSIIAGLVIRVGDKVVDASVQGKMQALKKQLTELKLA